VSSNETEVAIVGLHTLDEALGLKGEDGGVLVDRYLTHDLSFEGRGRVNQVANCKLFHDKSSLVGVRIGSKTRVILHLVASIEVLSDVAAHIFFQKEYASRMRP